MSARKPLRPQGTTRVQVGRTADQATNRALGVLASAVQKTQETRARYVVRQDLVVGVNKVVHSLGRACAGYTLTPTVASATFAHALDTTNLRPDREVWITVVGVAQPDARIEVF